MTNSFTPSPSAGDHNVFLKMLPITLAVFVGFLTIGLPLPVLPLHLHYTLGMSNLIVGIAIGCQFGAALLSRAWAGGLADTSGAKRTVVAGLSIASLSGATYLASLAFVATPTASLGVLLLGRVLLGCGESLIITGALSWGIGLVGPQNAGKVMAWVGIAMYCRLRHRRAGRHVDLRSAWICRHRHRDHRRPVVGIGCRGPGTPGGGIFGAPCAVL